MISTFYQNYSEKLIATLPPINSVPNMAKPIAKPMAKLINIANIKRGRLAKSSVK